MPPSGRNYSASLDDSIKAWGRGIQTAVSSPHRFSGQDALLLGCRGLSASVTWLPGTWRFSISHYRLERQHGAAVCPVLNARAAQMGNR